MRNGIYRVWYKGSGVYGTAATLLIDGQFVSCDRSHTYLGTYTEQNGRFHADIKVGRHTARPPAADASELDEFHLKVDGGSSEEIIAARCTIAEKPGFTLDVEYIWVSEV